MVKLPQDFVLDSARLSDENTTFERKIQPF